MVGRHRRCGVRASAGAAQQVKEVINMTVRTSRDWRGIKHHLGEYSTDELINLLNNAELTRVQVTTFAARVATELSRRGFVDRYPTAS